MRRLAERTAQVIVLSHNKQFLCRLWEGTDPTLRAALEVARDGAGSTIRAWDVSQDCITEHDRRHALLRQHVAGAAPNNRLVAVALRSAEHTSELQSLMRNSYAVLCLKKKTTKRGKRHYGNQSTQFPTLTHRNLQTQNYRPHT